jgi:hypothetical protein
MRTPLFAHKFFIRQIFNVIAPYENTLIVEIVLVSHSPEDFGPLSFVHAG